MVNGNEFAVLNPVARVTVTSFVFESYVIVEIPTPFEFWTGSNLGSRLLIPKVFSTILIWLVPNSNLRSTSVFWSPVFPSNNRIFGGMFP